MVQDDRTSEEKAKTIGFWVARDKFMSGWGQARGGNSYVACLVTISEDSDKVEKVFMNRQEFKNVRYVGANYRFRIGANDHLHIYNTTTSFRY